MRNGSNVPEHLATRGMVAMAVAVDQVRDRLAEPFGDLGLQPFSGFGVDRVGHDHTFVGDHNSGLVGIVGELPNIPGDVLEAALSLLGGSSLDSKQLNEA
jgi:hypothetical protein